MSEGKRLAKVSDMIMTQPEDSKDTMNTISNVIFSKHQSSVLIIFILVNLILKNQSYKLYHISIFKHADMKNVIFKFGLVLILLAFYSNISNANNDCAEVSQYGQGKAPVETNCVVSETGFEAFGIIWWANFYDGVAICCQSVMDCSKSCDKDSEKVCRKAGSTLK